MWLPTLWVGMAVAGCTPADCDVEQIRGQVAAPRMAQRAWSLDAQGNLQRVGLSRPNCPTSQKVTSRKSTLRVAEEVAWVANEQEVLRIRECEERQAIPLRLDSRPLENIDPAAVQVFDDERMLLFAQGPDNVSKSSPISMLYAYDGKELKGVSYTRAGGVRPFADTVRVKPDRMIRSKDGGVIWLVFGKDVCPVSRVSLLSAETWPECTRQTLDDKVQALSQDSLSGPAWVGTQTGAVRLPGASGAAPGQQGLFALGKKVDSISGDSEGPNVGWALVRPSTLYRLQIEPRQISEITLDGSFLAVQSLGRRLLLLGEEGVYECMDCRMPSPTPQLRRLAPGRFTEVFEGPGDVLWLSGELESAVCRLNPGGRTHQTVGAVSCLGFLALLGYVYHHSKRMKMKPILSWVHVSDLHFGHGDATHGWDQLIVLEALLSDVAHMVKKEPDLKRLGAIFVTGDIGFSGSGRIRKPDTQSREYEQAREWLQKLARVTKVELKQIFAVPGNHDVNRNVDEDKDVQRLVRGLREGEERLDGALAHPPDREKLARRMAAYLAFAADLAPACLEKSLRTPAERLFWAYRDKRNGLQLRVVGLNTALLSADEHDKGKLELGKEQLAKTLKTPPIAPDELVIVLSHHPLRGDWLRDGKIADLQVVRDAHIHLFGHLHEAEVESSKDGTGKYFVRMGAGASHDEASPPGVPATHGYSLACIYELKDGRLLLRHWPRRWSRTGFGLDPGGVNPDKDYAEHELSLPVTLRR